MGNVYAADYPSFYILGVEIYSLLIDAMFFNINCQNLESNMLAYKPFKTALFYLIQRTTRLVSDLRLMVKQLTNTVSILYFVVNEVEPRIAACVFAGCVTLSQRDIYVCFRRFFHAALHHSIAWTPDSLKHLTIVKEIRTLRKKKRHKCDIEVNHRQKTRLRHRKH